MLGLLNEIPLDRSVTWKVCNKPLAECCCPRAGDGNVPLPKNQPARLSREKHAGGKTITVITGIEPSLS